MNPTYTGRLWARRVAAVLFLVAILEMWRAWG